MATQINMQDTAPAPTNFPCGGVGGSNLGSITPALLEIASTMMELNNSYNQISMDSTNLQGLFNNEQTKETREEGKKGAAACYAQAAASGLSGAFDLGTAVGTKIGTSDEYSKLTQQSDELNKLESMQGKVQDQITKNGQNFESQEKDQVNPPRDPNVDARIKEMQSGQLLTSKIDPTAGEKKLGMTQEEMTANRTQQAIEGAGGKDLDGINDQIGKQITNKTQSINTLQNQIQSTENRIRMGFDMAKQAVNGGSQVAQGIFNDQKSQAQATGLSAQFDQQVQGTVAQTEQKAISENFSQTMSVFQALAQAGQAMV